MTLFFRILGLLAMLVAGLLTALVIVLGEPAPAPDPPVDPLGGGAPSHVVWPK